MFWISAATYLDNVYIMVVELFFSSVTILFLFLREILLLFEKPSFVTKGLTKLQYYLFVAIPFSLILVG